MQLLSPSHFRHARQDITMSPVLDPFRLVLIVYYSICFSRGEEEIKINKYAKLETNYSVGTILNSQTRIECAAICSSVNEVCVGFSVKHNGNGPCHIHWESTTADSLQEYASRANFVTFLTSGKCGALMN